MPAGPGASYRPGTMTAEQHPCRDGCRIEAGDGPRAYSQRSAPSGSTWLARRAGQPERRCAEHRHRPHVGPLARCRAAHHLIHRLDVGDRETGHLAGLPPDCFIGYSDPDDLFASMTHISGWANRIDGAARGHSPPRTPNCGSTSFA